MNFDAQPFYAPYYEDYRNMDSDLYQRPASQEQHVLHLISPVVSHGLREAQHLGYEHALREAVAIGYLMGRGHDYHTAWKTVESWWHAPGTHLPTPY